MDKELKEIKQAIDKIRTDVPWFRVYVTVSKSFNDELVKFLGWEDYDVWLSRIFDAEYSVSPFIDNNIKWMVWVFDYAQILGIWNATQDKQYRISHLFDNIVIKNAEKEEGWDSWENSND